MIQQPYETYFLFAILYFTVSTWFYVFDSYLILRKKANPVTSPLQWVVKRIMAARHKQGYTYSFSDDISLGGWIIMLAPVSMPIIIVKRIGNLFRTKRIPLGKKVTGTWRRVTVEPPILKCNICLNTNEYTGNNLVKDMEHETIRCAFCNSSDLCFISPEKKYK